jgi:hypothetical protein
VLLQLRSREFRKTKSNLSREHESTGRRVDPQTRLAGLCSGIFVSDAQKKLHKIKSASGGAWLSVAAGLSLGTAQYSGHLPKICIERFDLAATSLRLRCSARAVHA